MSRRAARVPSEGFSRVSELPPNVLLTELVDLSVEWGDLLRLVTEEPSVRAALGDHARGRSQQLIQPIVAALAGDRPNRAARIRAWSAFAVVFGGPASNSARMSAFEGKW